MVTEFPNAGPCHLSRILDSGSESSSLAPGHDFILKGLCQGEVHTGCLTLVTFSLFSLFWFVVVLYVHTVKEVVDFCTHKFR